MSDSDEHGSGPQWGRRDLRLFGVLWHFLPSFVLVNTAESTDRPVWSAWLPGVPWQRHMRVKFVGLDSGTYQTAHYLVQLSHTGSGSLVS